jgi:glycosyltransferase involved in cell wall biosynthesis
MSPDSGNIHVSVVTPVRNEAAVLRESAASIIGQTFDGALEFLFVDGDSSDGSREILDEIAEADPRVKVLRNPHGDLGHALAIGVQHARGEYLAKMDAHTFFPSTYLRTAVDRLTRGDVNWVSGPPVPRPNGPWSKRVALALGTRLGVGGSRKWSMPTDGKPASTEHELDTGVFSGVFLRSRLDELGGWDPDWPCNEDGELAARYLAAGERLLCLSAMRAWYVPRDSLSGLSRQYFRYGFYRVKTACRHPASLRGSHLLPPALLLASLGALLGRTSSRPLFRSLLALYVSALVVSAAATTDEGGVSDAALVPVVLAAMHYSFGVGMVAGSVRFGPPRRAAASLTAGVLRQLARAVAMRSTSADALRKPIGSARA